MTKIRKGIFETNSSSSHSFSMGPEGRFGSVLPMDADGVIQVPENLWDTSSGKTNDSLSKLSYLLAFAYTITIGPWDEDESEFEKYRDFIYKVVMDFTGASGIAWTPNSTIDHQSIDIIDPRDLLDPEFIKEFVFNEGTWIYTIWDSYDPEPGFYEDTRDSKLYVLSFNLPGISEGESTVEISYLDAKSEIDNVLYEFFKDLYYDPKTSKFIKIPSDQKIPGDLWRYLGGFEFGDIIDASRRIKIRPILKPYES